MTRILSCVPRQMTDTQEKLDWLERICESQQFDIIVTPQEFFGGAVMMPHQRDFKFDELFPQLSHLCEKYSCGMAVGVQEKDDDGSNRTAIWFIDEKGEYKGRICKFALPRYDHIDTKGFGQVSPEENLENRFKTFTIQGMEVAAIFCWEVYSDILWTGLGILKPDVVFSMIKFGPNAWPSVKKINGTNTVVDFGYGRWAKQDDGGWIERLRIANVWQVKCPIVCSTNAWNMNPRCLPMCGTISGIPGQAEEDVWYPQKEDKLKSIPEKIQITDIDKNAVRAALQNKWVYKDAIGQLPPMDLAKFTMHLKINRIEKRVISSTVQLEKKEKNELGLFNKTY